MQRNMSGSDGWPSPGESARLILTKSNATAPAGAGDWLVSMGMSRRLRIGALLLAGIAPGGVSANPPGAPTTATHPPTVAADRKEIDVRAAHLEVGQRIPEILGVLALPAGTPVATFGLTNPEFLDALLKQLGPEGRVVSIHRSFGSYLAEREGAARWNGRVDSIFAADGDAHLDAGTVGLVVAEEIDGFFLREPDLWRQAWNALRPDGKLVLLRLPRHPEPAKGASAPKTPPSAFAGKLAANREAVAMERAGFRWIENPKILLHWIVEVYRRNDKRPDGPGVLPQGPITPR